MDTVLLYRGRRVSRGDIVFIRELIATHPEATRRALSLKLCEAWNWVQENGASCDAVCRGLLLALHRAGHITLPQPTWVSRKPAARWAAPVAIDVGAQAPLFGPLVRLGPIEIRQVRRTPDEALVDGLIAQHHYLGFARPVGEQLKYLVTANERLVACFVWTSAARHLGPRDRHIGWSAAARRANIRFVAYQTRFLILPWVRVPHLASHLLGQMSRKLCGDWQQVYAHPIYFCETFVDAQRYRGTCYRAANWTYLGMTTGRGKDAPSKKPTRSKKHVFGYALAKDFRTKLCCSG
jgi:hypothetical protein